MLIILCLALSAGQALAGAERPSLRNLGKTLVIDAGDSKRMRVSFNHSTHRDIACRNCHHEGLPGNRYASCTNKECHAITAPSSREVLSVYMAFHAPGTKRSCFGCHKPLAGEYPGFKGCSPCHTSLKMQANLKR